MSSPRHIIFIKCSTLKLLTYFSLVCLSGYTIIIDRRNVMSVVCLFATAI